MKLSAVAKRMIFVIGILAVVLIVGGGVFYRSMEAVPFSLGVLLGCALSVLKVVMLERVVEKSLAMEQAQAAKHIQVQYIVRFVITGVVLAAAVKAPFVNLWGAVFGVLTLRVAASFTKDVA